jgi:cytochrome c556
MIKYVIVLLAGVVAGGFAGNTIAHRIAAPHRQPRAVMTLLGFHRERLDAASQAGQCATAETERARMASLQQEIALAFPLTYKQEAGFRKSADALGNVLRSIAPAAPAAPAAASASCPEAAVQFKKIKDSCDDCHKVYDPD